MVQKFVRDTMKEHGVRPTHIAYLLPIAVEATFIPTRSDVDAAKMRAATVVLDREDEIGRYAEGQATLWQRLWGVAPRYGLQYVK
jgi:hypothetical protein